MPLWAAVDTAAQLGCGLTRMCPVIPPARIGGVLPCAAGLALCQSAGGEAAATASEVVAPWAPANLKAGRVFGMDCFMVLCVPMASRWQGHWRARVEAGVV